MVLRNRLEYGFIGYQVPPTPRGTRSARKKSLFKKEASDNQMCAFELLATVAGELSLQEESPPNAFSGKDICRIENNSRGKEDQHADVPSEAGNGEKESCCTGYFVSNLESVLRYSECSDKVASAETLFHGKRETQLTYTGGMVHEPSSTKQKPCCTVNNESEQKIQLGPSKSATVVLGMKAAGLNMDDGLVEERKPPALVSTDISPALVRIDNGVMLPSSTDHMVSGSFPACRDDVQLVIRDDDENLYWGNRPGTPSRPFRPQRDVDRAHRRIRKLLASKYWMLTPKLKEDGQFNADSRLRPIHYNRKNCFKHLRSKRVYPSRKRKLYDYISISNSDRTIGSKCISSSLREGFAFDASASGGLREASVAAQHTPTQSRNPLVKFKIKSFKVPELFIEIPETSTVGSLKRTVMEALMSILGGELRVGVVLQGKKIGDDNKTLLQTGISRDNRVNGLAFSLEPNTEHASPSCCHGGTSLVLAYGGHQPPARYPSAPSVSSSLIKKRTADPLCDPPLAYFGNSTESGHDLTPSPDISIAKCPSDSRALVIAPQMSVAEAAVGPMRKAKSFEGAQRRIRRPFSVSEVESLVEAVEKLGTGRWRNVKLEAFDNAKHRTYVDLKDKWKTLVHTARLHPQQRRGEPVPQELLDRVLAAHSYWSKQHSKLEP